MSGLDPGSQTTLVGLGNTPEGKGYPEAGKETLALCDFLVPLGPEGMGCEVWSLLEIPRAPGGRAVPLHTESC